MRLFVAVRPSVEALAHLQAQLPRWPSAPERWHVTLAFLGEVEDPESLHEPLREAAAHTPALDLRLRGSGTFGGRGGHVWVGLDGDVAGLTALAGRVERACLDAGVEPPRRPYRPHLTVGRRGRPDPLLLSSYAGPAWTATEVELVRSHLGRPVEHVVLERFALRSG